MLLHARKLQKYLAVFLQLLDVGGYYTELVDTAAEHVGGAAHAVLHLLLQRCLGGVE